MKNIKTANILLIAVLVLVVVLVGTQLFGNEQINTSGGVTKSIFGLKYSGKDVPKIPEKTPIA